MITAAVRDRLSKEIIVVKVSGSISVKLDRLRHLDTMDRLDEPRSCCQTLQATPVPVSISPEASPAQKHERTLHMLFVMSSTSF